MERKLCAWVVARRKKRVIVTKNVCLALARKWDSASDSEIVWTKSVRGVWRLANVFANVKLYFVHNVPEANCLPQGLKPPAQPPAKPAPKAAKPRAKPSTKSAAKPAARVAAKPAAKPAAGEPIPVAPVEHVQLFRVKHSCQRKWHTEPVSQEAEHVSQ